MDEQKLIFSQNYSIMDLLQGASNWALLSLKIFYSLINILIIIGSCIMIYTSLKLEDYLTLLVHVFTLLFPFFFYKLFNSKIHKITFYNEYVKRNSKEIQYNEIKNFKIYKNILFCICDPTSNIKNISIPLTNQKEKIISFLNSKGIYEDNNSQ